MRISDLRTEEIKVGMRIKALTFPNLFGTITKIDYNDDRYATVAWDNADHGTSGFYGNKCECQIVPKPLTRNQWKEIIVVLVIIFSITTAIIATMNIMYSIFTGHIPNERSVLLMVTESFCVIFSFINCFVWWKYPLTIGDK
jgi:hypothetical protein